VERTNHFAEVAHIESWRVRLCARGLRQAIDRMTGAIAAGGLDVEEAVAIAETFDRATEELRRTAARLDAASPLRRAGVSVLAAFDAWRGAEAGTEESRAAAERFAELVRDLEGLSARREGRPS
jgi:hypothetical protein